MKRDGAQFATRNAKEASEVLELHHCINEKKMG